jgi:hypothetical protein
MKCRLQFLHRRELEILEPRIAPAGVFTFLDTDGDAVTVSSTRGTNADLAAAVQPFLSASGAGFQLQKVALNTAPAIFKGTTLVISAAPSAGGNGFVDVGHIDATGIDLGSVTIDGDLGQIDAGNANAQTSALRSLSAVSLGVRGLATQGAGGSLVSTILGGVGSLVLSGDLRGAQFQVLGSLVDPDPLTHSRTDAAAKIGAVRIGGSVIGSAEAGSGQIFAKGRIGTITLGGSIVGGTAAESGRLWAEGGITTATIDGSITGGTAAGATSSGQLFAGGDSGKILVKGQLIGGDGRESGFIGNGRGIDSVTILGGIEGGTGLRSGTVASASKIGLVSVGGDIIGSKGEESGVIRSTLSIQTVKIVGDVFGGAGARSGLIGSADVVGTIDIDGSVIGGDGEQSGAVGSIGKLGDVKVTGDVRGGLGARSGQIVSQSTIRSVTIDGSVIGSLAFESGSIGSFGGLGPVKIGGDLVGGAGAFSGAILAGAEDHENDSPASIASVTIGGDITALLDDGGDAGDHAGSILTDGALGPVRVEGAVLGGNGFRTGVVSGGSIKSVSIGDDLRGGAGPESGGIVSTSGSIGAVVIGGALRSGTALASGYVMSADKLTSVQADSVAGGGRSRALISALNEIGSVTVTEFIEYADIFAGLNLSRQFTESGARIGTVTIGTTSSGESTPYILATNIVASALPGLDGAYGTRDDISLSGAEGGGLSRIGSVIINGEILDQIRQFLLEEVEEEIEVGFNFGIVADQVVRVIVAGQTVAQEIGPRNDFIPIGESTLTINEMERDE